MRRHAALREAQEIARHGGGGARRIMMFAGQQPPHDGPQLSRQPRGVDRGVCGEGAHVEAALQGGVKVRLQRGGHVASEGVRRDRLEQGGGVDGCPREERTGELAVAGL